MDAKIIAATVEATVTAVVFHNEENGWSVLRMHSGKKQFTAVGYVPGVTAGERLVLGGSWGSHAAYGEQFKAEQVRRLTPVGRDAIYEYLAFGAVKGIGPALASVLTDKFGDGTLDIIENHPEELERVRGIGPSKARAISKDFKRRTGLRRLMEFLVQVGLRPVLAARLYKVYGDNSIEIVKENPYVLTADIIGADFFEADKLALNLGFEGDANERVEAAVLFELRYNSTNGHTFIPRDKLIAATDQLISCGTDAVSAALEMLSESGYIVIQPLAGLEACYLADMHAAECLVSDRIRELAAIPLYYKGNLDKLISAVEKEQCIEYAQLQRKAVELAATSRVMVLTGGPGTGKTTCLRGIAALYDRLGYRVSLAAPTGRAAKRMSELIGDEAQTVHRLLGASMDDETGITMFDKNADDPLDCDAVILDETSMVDIKLMCALLDAMPAGCRLVMVGDADQLPPVGPGNVFSEVIRSGIVPTVRLTEIFRQAQESMIVKNAHSINEGVVDALSQNGSDYFFLRRPNAARTADTVVELFSSRLPKNMGIDPGKIQVLSPTRKRDAGTENLNRVLQAALNPADPKKQEIAYGSWIFREGDRVMQIKNNYDIVWKRSADNSLGTGVFNGDMGIILSVDKQRELVTVDFDGRVSDYPFEMLGEMEPAWAVTVHKSQGSEYKAVILAVSDVPRTLMTRSLLYTAVTRARDLLVIVGDSETAVNMALNDRRQRRYSALRLRLCDEV